MASEMGTDVATTVSALERQHQQARDTLDQLEHCDAQAAYLLAHSLTQQVETLLDDSRALRARLFEVCAGEGRITLRDARDGAVGSAKDGSSRA